MKEMYLGLQRWFWNRPVALLVFAIVYFGLFIGGAFWFFKGMYPLEHPIEWMFTVGIGMLFGVAFLLLIPKAIEVNEDEISEINRPQV